MIIDFDFKETENKYSDQDLKDLKKDLEKLQLQCHLNDISVIIVIDGWESSGKGRIINEITQRLETKAYSVGIFGEEYRDDYLISREFWEKLPANGDFAIFDRSHYTDLYWDLDAHKDTIDRNIGYLLNSEETVIENNTLILKFFINIKKSSQRKRIEELAYDNYKDFMVNELDVYQNLYYDKFQDHIDYILEKSNTEEAPWTILNGEDIKESTKEVIGLTIDRIKDKLDQLEEKDNFKEEQVERDYIPVEILEKVPKDLKVSDQEYEDQLEPLQEEASDLAYGLYKENIPAIIVFEGVDAAGKGGAIKRLTKLMDPRAYKVNPTSAPSDREKDHHYLWRFYNNFPKKGEIDIFDRSWYGRVMVERVEELTPVEDWARAYDEINAMEKELVESGTILIKYFLSIDKDEQLDRFEDRAEDKPHKLTDEDWRNRENWDENILAMNEMLYKTSTKYAPWEIIAGNQKKYARLEVLKIFIEKVKAYLGQ